MMTGNTYPRATPEIAARRRQLAPEISDAFDTFSRLVFTECALSERTKQLTRWPSRT